MSQIGPGNLACQFVGFFFVIGCKTLKILPFILPLEGPKDAKPFLNFIIIPLTTKND